MQERRISSDAITYSSLLKECAASATLSQCHLIHQHVKKSGVQLNEQGYNALIKAYSKHGDVRTANDLFNIVLAQGTSHVITWTLMMSVRFFFTFI
jgi:pentatricopeptide repeat protein